MRRASWRSVPRMCRPPAASTFSLLLGAAGRGTSRAAAAYSSGSWAGSASARARPSGLPPSMMSVPRPAMLVAMVTAPWRPAWATIAASRSWFLALSTSCGTPRRLSSSRELLRLLDRDRADEHRLALLVELDDLLDDRLPLLLLGAVDDVGVVLADHRPVGRDDDDVEPVDLRELLGLGLGGAGHAGELLVHAEVVLEGDRGQGLVLGLDLDALLGLDRLVQAVGPAPAGHQAAGELVDDDDLAVLDDVVDVLLVEGVGAQRLLDGVERLDVGRVVEVAARRAASRPWRRPPR